MSNFNTDSAGFNDGYKEGLEAGYNTGYDKGYNDAFLAGWLASDEHRAAAVRTEDSKEAAAAQLMLVDDLMQSKEPVELEVDEEAEEPGQELIEDHGLYCLVKSGAANTLAQAEILRLLLMASLQSSDIDELLEECKADRGGPAGWQIVTYEQFRRALTDKSISSYLLKKELNDLVDRNIMLRENGPKSGKGYTLLQYKLNIPGMMKLVAEEFDNKLSNADALGFMQFICK